MYTFFLMVEDYIKTHNLHLFMFFFAFIFIRWGIVFFHAIRYKPYDYEDKEINYFTSVLLPVVDEPLDLFYSVLMKIARQNPSEIIVVINGPKTRGLKTCVQISTGIYQFALLLFSIIIHLLPVREMGSVWQWSTLIRIPI